MQAKRFVVCVCERERERERERVKEAVGENGMSNIDRAFTCLVYGS